MLKETYFGNYGGQFVPELLMPPLLELQKALEEIVLTEFFRKEFLAVLRDYVGRPTPLTYCSNLSEELGFGLWLKREDLAHTGAHKINNTIGQALLAKRMNKHCLLAETGAGQHGVATATAAAMLGLDCIVYMGAKDVGRQQSNVHRMKLLGAKVVPVQSSTQTLKDAINAALRHWIARQETAHYCLGSVVGPHPFPTLVRHLQSVIGQEAKQQFKDKMNRLPDQVLACVGGGSNALGMFQAFIPERSVELIGVEAGGSGEPGCYHSATLSRGSPGVLHGTKTYLIQTPEGQILPSHSIAPGLDYPGVGPEHVRLQEINRVKYVTVQDKQALDAFEKLSRREGIIPALESAHALAWALQMKDGVSSGQHLLINLSGRGDKDLSIVHSYQQGHEET